MRTICYFVEDYIQIVKEVKTERTNKLRLVANIDDFD